MSLPEMHNSHRILSTLSRVEVDNTPLPNGEQSTLSLNAAQLLPIPVNVYVPSEEKVEDDRIKRAIEANPMSNTKRPVSLGISEPISEKARRRAADRTGRMLDFCTPFRLGDQTRGTVPGTISINGEELKELKNDVQGKEKGKRQGRGEKQIQPKKKKKKLSKSQLQGRARLRTDRGERFLASSIGSFDIARASKSKIKTSRSENFSLAKIQEWFADIPEEFRVCELPSSPILNNRDSLGSTGSLKPLKSKQIKRRASMSELIKQDEQKYQDKYKRKKSGKSKNKGKGKRHSKKTKKKPNSPRKEKPNAYFRVNKNGLVPADQSFDALTKVIVGFDTFERGARPKRVPTRLAQFWEHHKASGVGPKILSDGFTLSEFEVSIKKLGQLEVSKEMQAAMKNKVLQPDGRGGKSKTMTDIWSDFWVDEVGSELAAPLDSSIFVAGGSGLGPDGSALQAPAFMISTNDPIGSATANLPHSHKRFAFASHTHTAAARIQKIYHRRRAVRDFCSTKISSVFHGYKARKIVKNRKQIMTDSALLIATAYRGLKARQYVSFIRTTGWNHIAILCQRCIRRYLAKKEANHRRFMRTFNGATNIQRVWRGIWGRAKFKQWKLYVRDRSAKSIQNMVRWHNFREAHEQYRFNLEVACDDVQRVFRGYIGRKKVRYIRLRIFSALQIQRVYQGYLGRRRFKRKMAVIRTACVTIQIRVRGIRDRKRAGQRRTEILTIERDRTDKEEAAFTRRLEETRDYLNTNKGKMEHNNNRKKIRVEKSGDTAAFILLSQRKKRLRTLKNKFILTDFRSTGLIDRFQFKNLLVNELHINMNKRNLDNAWSKTSTNVAKRGGYRLCDHEDRRELEEIVEWYESGADRKTGIRAGFQIVRKKTSKKFSCKPGSVSRLAKKKIFLRNRLERLMVFRQDRPPPFSCSTCTKRFVFTYELERHRDKGKVKGTCPGKYYCPVLDD